MRIEGNKPEFFQSLYEDWKRRQEDNFRDLEKWMKQYKGDKAIDGSNVEATAIRNITYELIEAQVGTEIPMPKVSPKKWSEGKSRCARAIEQYLVTLRDELPFEKINDLEERYTYIFGGAAFVIEWDSTYQTHNQYGRPSIRLVNPIDIVGQPGVYDIQDMDACFVRVDTTKEDIMARYGVKYEVADKAEQDSESDREDDTVAVITCWYFDANGYVSKFVWSGDVVLEDIEDYWARKRKVCADCGKSAEIGEDEDKPGKCKCGGKIIVENDEYEELTHDIVRSDGSVLSAYSPVYKDGKPVYEKRTVIRTDANGNPAMQMDESGLMMPVSEEVEEPKMAPTRIPWYRPNLIPIVIRKNTSLENSLLGQSECEVIRPFQQQINKIESRIQEKLMSAGVYPVMPEDSRFIYDNTIFTKVLKLSAGENKNMYGTVSTMVDITADIAQSDRIYDQAKRATGISDSYMGQADTTAKSGVAKQIQVQQSAGRLASKRVMKQAAYSEIDEILFQYSLAYADEPRPFAYQDEFGYTHYGAFNRYDFVEYDDSTGEYYYDDAYTFGADRTGGIEQQAEQMWQLIQADYTSGLFGDPNATVTRLAVWLAREKAGYPGASVQVAFFKKLLEEERKAAEARQQAQQQIQAQQMQPPQIQRAI